MTKGEKIKELRISKGLTQEDLAAKTDISTRTVQRIESGEVSPRAFTLQALAKALDIDFEELNAFPDSALKQDSVDREHIWLPLVHLSAFFLFIIPTVVIWILKKEEVKNISKHARDVINFQISLTIYMLILMIIIPPFAILLIIYHVIIIMVNTVKVLQERPYHYPLVIRFIRS